MTSRRNGNRDGRDSERPTLPGRVQIVHVRLDPEVVPFGSSPPTLHFVVPRRMTLLITLLRYLTDQCSDPQGAETVAVTRQPSVVGSHTFPLKKLLPDPLPHLALLPVGQYRVTLAVGRPSTPQILASLQFVVAR